MESRVSRHSKHESRSSSQFLSEIAFFRRTQSNSDLSAGIFSVSLVLYYFLQMAPVHLRCSALHALLASLPHLCGVPDHREHLLRLRCGKLIHSILEICILLRNPHSKVVEICAGPKVQRPNRSRAVVNLCEAGFQANHGKLHHHEWWGDWTRLIFERGCPKFSGALMTKRRGFAEKLKITVEDHFERLI